MADLSVNFCGIKSPNPFWLASAPPTDKAYNVVRAFEAGWGGVVWKTLGEDPPVTNVSSRYGSLKANNAGIAGFNNIELISDRALEINLKEIKEVKKLWPDRAIIVSLMVPLNEKSWKDILYRVKDTGCDGVELNFGCPHGMSERGMGAAIGQVPEYIEQITKWCTTYSNLPVIVKLTPNVTNIVTAAEAAFRGKAHAVSLINTINSIVSIDLDEFCPNPKVDGKGTHGGYCGPAVKPIALNMVAEISRNTTTKNLPISAIGGIGTWRDAAEFIALGAGTVQVCTAAMNFGFRIVQDMCNGLSLWMKEKGYNKIEDFRGKASTNVCNWKDLNQKYKVIAKIDQDACIKCGLCYIACEDTSHQSISKKDINGQPKYEIIDDECVGCNLCQIVCPVSNCIEMVEA